MKIKIKSKGFPTTHYGYLEPNKEYNVSDDFGRYCVDKMKSAEQLIEPKKSTRKKVIKK